MAEELARLVDEAKAAGAFDVRATDAGIVAGGDVIQLADGDITGRDKIGGDQIGGHKITFTKEDG